MELELQDKCWVAPTTLQHWLQLTYELELKSYNKKRSAAERQLRQAKEAVMNLIIHCGVAVPILVTNQLALQLHILNFSVIS